MVSPGQILGPRTLEILYRRLRHPSPSGPFPEGGEISIAAYGVLTTSGDRADAVPDDGNLASVALDFELPQDITTAFQTPSWSTRSISGLKGSSLLFRAPGRLRDGAHPRASPRRMVLGWTPRPAAISLW